MGRPVAGLCRPAFLRPTPADPNERRSAPAMLRPTPLLPIQSRCARAQWPVGWRHLAMELAIQVARVLAPPRDGSARILRLAHLMTFQLTPIGPLNPLRQLLVPAVPH